jgi:hypothetical protein
MNTKDTIHSQLEHLQMKYAGTGHSDTSKQYEVEFFDTLTVIVNGD